eukprot:TRINITY_DN1483_c0_g1_i1.p1 TRINITY_DN1483_c0_g1~~TRINITY_DN1483_c0_g1_i1.p1  ORF type:complete len:443 (-),score=135.49 TRINITY_DN1483_c0_g1_i1:111-1397(-)
MASLSLRGAQLLKVQTGSTSALANVLPSCNYASEVRPRKIDTASMKRGRGGRSSFSGDVVTVFGGNGFIGRGIANRLGKNGSQTIYPYRGEHYKMLRLKVTGDLGQVLFCPMELKDEDSIRRAVSHSNIVINLIGRGVETSNFSYEDVNITGPQTIARLCKEAGVKRLVHMSHINAREEPETAFLPGGSRFLKTKFMGELAVKSEFPEATIFRASDVYGQGDSYLNHYFSRWRKSMSKGMPLFGKGEMTVKQPIWMSDLVTGIMNSLYDPAALGETYEAVGPDRLTQHELLTYIYNLTTRSEEAGTFKITELMMDPATMIRAFLIGKSPFGTVNTFHQYNLDRLERDSISDMSEGVYPDLTDLGVKLHTLQDKMPWEVKPWDLYSYYHYEGPEEKPVVAPPLQVTMEQERKIQQRRGLGPIALVPGLL